MTKQNYDRGILIAQAQSTQTIFGNQTPSNPNATDGVSYELGLKFRSDRVGQITAIRYWKASSETGTHVGKIWTSTGSVLASVSFSNETASGWQQQSLNTPLNILANTTYVVSVNANSHFPIAYDALASSVVSGDLSSVADGNNGVYGSPNSLPTNSYWNSNYFRDIVFVAGGSTITKVSGDNQNGTTGTNLPNPLVVQVRNSAGNPQQGVTVNFAVTGGGGSVSPTSAQTNANGQASTVLRLGTTAGATNTVSATASGVGSVTFSAKANASGTNPIFLENQKPGDPNWRITDQATSEIAGYATATSVNKGGSLPIKVSLSQSGIFTIEVYRLGYYGGAGGRRILSSGSLNGITQPQCTVTNSSTRLVECNWSTSYTLQVGSDWTSGLYIAKLIDQRSGKQSQVWFVVRDDSSKSDILFQSSFTTFLAYNATGGYSLYGFNSINGQKARKVSYDRPFDQTLGSEEFNDLLRWEYNMARWLESQGYDVSYVTNMDVHSNPNLLRQHKVFLSVGHDEYWSLEERNGVEQARNAKVNLAFFSANSAYWRVRFEKGRSGETNRTMVCYKEAATSSEPTNKFRSSLNNRPESALMGVMYGGDKDIVYAGFDFVVKNSSDPYYAHTNLKDGDTLSQLVGFEWDAINPNASPSGLVVLAESQFPTSQSLDASDLEGFPSGTNPRVAHAVRYTAPSGAQVFSTGSIQWMWGLDSDGVSSPREDIRAKQIAVNVLANMGARPLTPGANIIVP